MWGSSRHRFLNVAGVVWSISERPCMSTIFIFSVHSMVWGICKYDCPAYLLNYLRDNRIAQRLEACNTIFRAT